MSDAPTSQKLADGLDQLTELLRQLSSEAGLLLSASTQLTPVLNAFRPTSPTHDRSLAFLVLSKTVSNARPKVLVSGSHDAQERATANLTKLFSPLILPRISSTDAAELLPGLGLFTALFQVDQATASQILLTDGTIESLMDATDLFDGKDGISVCQSVANLLSQASASKTCRPIVQAHASSWLQTQVKQATDPTLRAAVAITVTKLSRGSEEDAQADPVLAGAAASKETTAESEALVVLMRGLVMDESKPANELAGSSTRIVSQATLDAVEGLAYLTSHPETRETLSSDAAFLSRLFALVPSPKKRQTGPVPIINTDSPDFDSPQVQRSTFGLLYGIAAIISNIVAFKPLLSEEEKQVDKLRKMTQAGARADGDKLAAAPNVSDKLTEDAAVKRRCKRLLKSGVVPALVSISTHAEGSEAVRRAVSKSMLSLAEEKENRGKIIQAGGAKAVQAMIRTSLTALEAQPAKAQAPKGKFDTASRGHAKALDHQDILAIQALAKLSITASPLLLFGPDASSSLDAVRPLSHLLLNPSSTLLQRFESLMALTNLASLGPVVASRVASHKESGLGNVLGKTETLLLDDNHMVRRGAMELICNLISSDEVWERYTGEKPNGTVVSSGTGGSNKTLVSRLRIILALSDVEDDGTRLAASGALAMLSSSSNVCRTLMEDVEDGPKKTFGVLVDLIDPTAAPEVEEELDDDNTPEPLSLDLQPQFIHRGVVTVRNILTNLASQSIRKGTIPDVLTAAESTGLSKVLVATLTSPTSSGNMDVLTAVAQSLRWLKDHGLKLPGM